MRTYFVAKIISFCTECFFKIDDIFEFGASDVSNRDGQSRISN